MIDVSIELTNLCNAKCIFCPHKDTQREKGCISWNTLQQITDTLQGMDISAINPVGLGEPFLHPAWFSMIYYLHEAFPGVPVRITTNGLLLNDENRRRLVKVLNEKDSLNVSLNFSNAQEYKEMMGVDAYERVKKNILALLALKPKFQTKVQFMLTKKNFWKLPAFALYWKPKVDILMIRPIEDWGGRMNTRRYQIFNYNPPDVVKQRAFTWNGEERRTCLELADEGRIIMRDFNDVQRNWEDVCKNSIYPKSDRRDVR